MDLSARVWTHSSCGCPSFKWILLPESGHTLSCGCPSFKWIHLPKSKHILTSAFFCFLYILLYILLLIHANMPLGISSTFVWTQLPVFGRTTLDTGSTCIKVSAMVFRYCFRKAESTNVLKRPIQLTFKIRDCLTEAQLQRFS